jgi:hypothetical protein
MTYVQWISPQAQIAVNEIVRERLEEELDPELAVSRGIDRAPHLAGWMTYPGGLLAISLVVAMRMAFEATEAP